jgi:CRISPR-associated protein Cmr6
MPIAAIPDYFPKQLREASPGLRFGAYLPIWTTRADQEKSVKERSEAKSHEGREVATLLHTRGMDATITELCSREKNRLEGLWGKNKSDAHAAWKQITALTTDDQNRLTGLRSRQRALAQASGAISLHAIAVAPFSTGLGNEHPLENGFAFLNPYGLPYLPGSGVKGVLRRAAQELADGQWGDKQGWRKELEFNVPLSGMDRIALSVIDLLFGREPPAGDSDTFRGVLSFWDVYPSIEGNQMLVEVMTPHQGHYYQQDAMRDKAICVTPHDSGNPIPICFLTVPPGSCFDFHFIYDQERLKILDKARFDGKSSLFEEIEGQPRWRALLEAAFKHAFDWLGFGAKTAVGYGAMQAQSTEELEKRLVAENSAAEERRIRVQRELELARQIEERRLAEKARCDAEARAKAEEQARLVAMSPAQRELAELASKWQEILAQKNFRQDETDNKSKHWRALDELSRKALSSWGATDCQATVDLINEWGPKLLRIKDEKDFRRKMRINELKAKV